jgi:hypothetical protein
MKAFSAPISLKEPHPIATLGLSTLLLSPQPMKEFSAFCSI